MHSSSGDIRCEKMNIFQIIIFCIDVLFAHANYLVWCILVSWNYLEALQTHTRTHIYKCYKHTSTQQSLKSQQPVTRQLTADRTWSNISLKWERCQSQADSLKLPLRTNSANQTRGETTAGSRMPLQLLRPKVSIWHPRISICSVYISCSHPVNNPLLIWTSICMRQCTYAHV